MRAWLMKCSSAFADAVYRDRLRKPLVAWSGRIDAVYKIVVQLTAAGEASGYDRRRLDRERLAAQARLGRADADYGRSFELLLAATGGRRGTEAGNTVGDLTPAVMPALTEAEDSLRRRPELLSLVAQADAFERERRAAEHRWLGDLTFGGGLKRVDEPGRSGNGILLSVSFPLPVFDRGQAVQQRASAEAAALRAEQTLNLARWEGELRATWRQADDLRRNAIAFRKEMTSSAGTLSRIAEEAYRGGESTLLELLDAYRVELEAETLALDLELAARRARIELDQLSGMVAYE